MSALITVLIMVGCFVFTAFFVGSTDHVTLHRFVSIKVHMFIKRNNAAIGIAVWTFLVYTILYFAGVSYAWM